MSFPESSDWIPLRFSMQQGQAIVEWCYLDRRRFTDPFFENTLQHCKRMPFNMLFRRQTTVDALLQWQLKRPGLTPTGFIFHMSRCGSTLVAQMLASLQQNVVLSEARPIDDVLTAIRADSPVAEAQRIDWLRSMISALGQCRYPDERQLFIKFDCWQTQDLPLLRSAFPQTPWIFLYRNPLEVMMSHVKMRGKQLVSSLMDGTRFGIASNSSKQISSEEYAARVLAAIMQPVLDNGLESSGLLVNYRQLPQAVTTTIADHFGSTWTAVEKERMLHVTQFDAKNPCLYFTVDQEEKQQPMTAAIAESTERWLMPLYERLETLRRTAETKNG